MWYCLKATSSSFNLNFGSCQIHHPFQRYHPFSSSPPTLGEDWHFEPYLSHILVSIHSIYLNQGLNYSYPTMLPLGIPTRTCLFNSPNSSPLSLPKKVFQLSLSFPIALPCYPLPIYVPHYIILTHTASSHHNSPFVHYAHPRHPLIIPCLIHCSKTINISCPLGN